jgi:protein TonB
LAASPLIKSSQNLRGEDHWVTNQELESLKQKEQQLLIQLKSELQDERSSTEPTPDQDKQKKREAMLKWLAQIDARIAQENSRPRRRYLSPSTQKVAYAVYYERVRTRIESTGTQYFPQVSGQRLYGQLTLEFTLNSKGELISQALVKGSGNAALDARAMAILKKSQPFDAFGKELNQEADELSIVSVFHFNKAGISASQE